MAASCRLSLLGWAHDSPEALACSAFAKERGWEIQFSNELDEALDLLASGRCSRQYVVVRLADAAMACGGAAPFERRLEGHAHQWFGLHGGVVRLVLVSPSVKLHPELFRSYGEAVWAFLPEPLDMKALAHLIRRDAGGAS